MDPNEALTRQPPCLPAQLLCIISLGAIPYSKKYSIFKVVGKMYFHCDLHKVNFIKLFTLQYPVTTPFCHGKPLVIPHNMQQPLHCLFVGAGSIERFDVVPTGALPFTSLPFLPCHLFAFKVISHDSQILTVGL